MPKTKTEVKGLNWIAKTTGYSESEIAFSNNSSPDFITPDGQAFEIKRYPILLWPRQWEGLCRHPDCKIVVFRDYGDEPVAVIPISEITFRVTRKCQSIPIHYYFYCPGDDQKALPREEYLEKARQKMLWFQKAPYI